MVYLVCVSFSFPVYICNSLNTVLNKICLSLFACGEVKIAVVYFRDLKASEIQTIYGLTNTLMGMADYLYNFEYSKTSLMNFFFKVHRTIHNLIFSVHCVPFENK